MRFGSSLFAIASILLLPSLASAEPSREKLVELGRRLFMDPTVSRSGRFSCASCHDPEHGFSDPRVQSIEHDGPSERHSQPLADLMDGSGMHRDGEFATVRELLGARLLPTSTASFSIHRIREERFKEAVREGRHPDKEAFAEAEAKLPPPEIRGNVGTEPRPRTPFTPVADRLRNDERYRAAFEDAFGTDHPSIEKLIDALEAYVLSLRTEENSLDRFLSGEPGALTAAERRGYDLFAGRANCASCHSLEPVNGRAPLTDHGYHFTGVALPELIVVDGKWRDGDGGRGRMTHVSADLGRFKTPSLRDVGRRAPYMHDGSLATLEEVVAFYDRGGRPDPQLDPAIKPLNLTPDERADLVAFLKALTAPRRGGVGPAPYAQQQTRLRIVDEHGRPITGLSVKVVPFGDRLGERSRAARDPLTLVTDGRGQVSFPFPSWTHVVVEADGLEVGCGLPIPDSVRSLELRAVPVVLHFVEIVLAPSLPRTIEALDPKTCQVVAVLQRVRKAAGGRALYRMTEIKRSGRVVVHLSNDGRARGVSELDLSGGESDAISIPSPAADRLGVGGEGYG